MVTHIFVLLISDLNYQVDYHVLYRHAKICNIMCENVVLKDVHLHVLHLTFMISFAHYHSCVQSQWLYVGSPLHHL